MKVKEIEFDLVPYLRERFGHPERTVGLHVSQIYGDLNNRLNPRKANGFTEDDLDAFGTVGFLWERVLETILADIAFSGDPARYFRPGEQEHMGILLTPDYADLDFHGDGTCVMGLEEWKVKWRSVRSADDLEKNYWVWLVQMKAYCYVLGIRHARLRAIFIVGNWRDNIVPTPRMWEFEFTQTELQENWTMLINHGKRKGWVK